MQCQKGCGVQCSTAWAGEGVAAAGQRQGGPHHVQDRSVSNCYASPVHTLSPSLSLSPHQQPCVALCPDSQAAGQHNAQQICSGLQRLLHLMPGHCFYAVIIVDVIPIVISMVVVILISHACAVPLF